MADFTTCRYENSKLWLAGFLTACIGFLSTVLAFGQDANPEKTFLNENEINLYCLRQSYPQITDIIANPKGEKILVLSSGQTVPYNEAGASSRNVGVAESMRQIYPLEPDRPDTMPGVAPGRQRPYAFFDALYGHNPETVKKNLASTRMFGANIQLAQNARDALVRALPELESLARDNPELGAFLKPEGGYYWRRIAGEENLSAHSYGIALDIGVDKSPYWRWSKRMPHPAQKTWPAAIVKIMEENGFIWGGKWREYDLMHFEYRPELICKARMLKKKSGTLAR